MTSLDPLYTTLGLDPEEAHTNESLLRAYRKQAKYAHPDTGGSAEAFHAVTQAFRILSTPELLEEFKATGRADTSQSPKDRKKEHARSMLITTFGQVVQRSDQSTLEHTDILGQVQDRLLQDARQAEHMRKQAQRALEVLLGVKKRLRFTGREGKLDVLGAWLHQEQERIEQQAAKFKWQTGVAQLAAEMVELYEYEPQLFMERR